jgi:hypothetical protein
MMIRRFAGVDGKLVELVKPKLEIGTRRRAPSKILYGENIYRNQALDLDENLFTPIEQTFCPIYPQLADNDTIPSLEGKAGAALIDWIASLLVRTQLHSFLPPVHAKLPTQFGKLIFALAPKSILNIARIQLFEHYQDLLSRPQFVWKVRSYYEDEFLVLTDYPVFQTLGDRPVVIVPLSKHRVLIGGDAKNLDDWQLPIDRMNLVLAAYADRSVFCADKAVLEVMVNDLLGNNPELNSAWCEDARLPFCGFLHGLKNQEYPVNIDLSKWMDELKNSFGDSIIPPDLQAKRAAVCLHL